MADPFTTCWTLIHGAAAGRREDREEFARRYESPVRAYLAARWRGTPRIQEIDDAAQEVFLECFRSGGMLDRVDDQRPGGFRAFLYGAVRNVARRIEGGGGRRRERQTPTGLDLDGIETDEETLSRLFDRAWALSLVKEAVELHAERARASCGAAERRVELLRLRFRDELPIREIAVRWETDAARLHEQYRQARRELKAILLELFSLQYPGRTAGEVERECARLLELVKE